MNLDALIQGWVLYNLPAPQYILGKCKSRIGNRNRCIFIFTFPCLTTQKYSDPPPQKPEVKIVSLSKINLFGGTNLKLKI